MKMLALRKTREQYLFTFTLIIFTFISYALAIENVTSTKPVNLLQLKNPDIGTEQKAIVYLQDLEGRYSVACNKQMVIRWNYTTNVTDQTGKLAAEAETDYLNFQAKIQKEILEKFPNWHDFHDESLKRQFQYLAICGPATMNPSDVANMTELQREMESDYATAGVCGLKDPNNCTFRLDPEIERILTTSQDPQVLAHYWTAWHDKMSEKVSPKKFQRYLQYKSEMAKANGFRDMSEMWLIKYNDGSPDWTTEKFKENMLNIWEEIRPMYETLHAYVRMKLRRIPQYKRIIGKCGYIPAYLTGNMWAQHWMKLADFTKPYPDAPSMDATEAMIKANYTVLKVFQESDKFFTELGLYPMTNTFWEKSMLERPIDGRQVVCHASSSDFCLGKNSTDFRIKQCTKVNMDQLLIAHHEMGHIQYFQQYTNLNFGFRDGANPGFHEAIGDALSLAVVTPKHLQCVLGLDLKFNQSICNDNDKPTQAPTEVTETDINYLYNTALEKLAFFPFAMSMEMWRWEAFQGQITPDQYNERWWQLRQKNQGISPPNNRSSPNLFDPAAKYHIVANVEYLRYFISHILQFQFYEAMCIAAGQYEPISKVTRPLYKCDFAGSKKAGKLLGDMMKLGSSKAWPIALEAITGNKTISISSLKNYFQPLLNYMTNELNLNGEIAGFSAQNCK